ncbi:nucleoredoxin-like protein 2 isoform X1 [Heptranchias perlo]|uniref:nucleoredoxin-like protein 2 isoform X1 n=1 Tax=Heptranchias perlo TaxID=212740 RepID=UPI00355AA0AE
MVDVFAGHTLVTKDGEEVDPEEGLKNKVVGIYFSGGWCPPCRDFTPLLCKFYTELTQGTEPAAQFEIVFVSSDRSEDDMANYMGAMHGDWLALPWQDAYKKSRIRQGAKGAAGLSKFRTYLYGLSARTLHLVPIKYIEDICKHQDFLWHKLKSGFNFLSLI